MSKKSRKGSLGPVFSINQLGDVGLGVESELGLIEMENGFYDRDRHTRKGSMASVQEDASVTLALEIGAEGDAQPLMPPMLGREVEEELVAENQAATLPAVTLNEETGRLGVYFDDDGAKDVDEGTSDRDDIVNDSGMGSGKGNNIDKDRGGAVGTR
ncbi:hypothetical protein AHAS_Ahas20G0112800 [Arachis hypogaea]